MRKRFWLRAIGVAAVLLLIAVLLGWYLLLPAGIAHLLRSELRGAGWTLSSGPEVSLAPGRVTVRDLSTSAPQDVSIQSVEADWTLGSLLAGELTDIRIRNVAIRARPGTDGEADPWGLVGAVLGSSLGPMPFRSVRMTDARLEILLPESTVGIDLAASVLPDGEGGLEARARAEAASGAVTVELRGRTGRARNGARMLTRLEVGGRIASVEGLNALLVALDADRVGLESGAGAFEVTLAPTGGGWQGGIRLSLREVATAGEPDAERTRLESAAVSGRARLGPAGDLRDAELLVLASGVVESGRTWREARLEARKEGRDAVLALRLAPDDAGDEPAPADEAGGTPGPERLAGRLESVFSETGRAELPPERLEITGIHARLRRLLPPETGLTRLEVHETQTALAPPPGGWEAVPDLVRVDPLDAVGRIVRSADIGRGVVRGPVAGTLRDIPFSGRYSRTGEMAGEIEVTAGLPGGEVRAASRVDAPAGTLRFQLDSDELQLGPASGWLPAFPGFGAVDLAGTASLGIDLALEASGWSGRFSMAGNEVDARLGDGGGGRGSGSGGGTGGGVLAVSGRELRLDADFTATRALDIRNLNLSASTDASAVTLPDGTRFRGESVGTTVTAETTGAGEPLAIVLNLTGTRLGGAVPTGVGPPYPPLAPELGEAPPPSPQGGPERGGGAPPGDLSADLEALSLDIRGSIRDGRTVEALRMAFRAEGAATPAGRVERFDLRFLQEEAAGYVEATGAGAGWVLSRLSGEVLGFRPWMDRLLGRSGLGALLGSPSTAGSAPERPAEPLRARGLDLAATFADVAELTVQLDAEYRPPPRDVPDAEPSLRLQARNGALRSPELAIEGRGLYGEILLTGLDPLRSPPGQRIGIGELTLGAITLRDCWTTFGIERLPLSPAEEAAIHVERLEWEWGEGRIRGTDFRVDPWSDRLPVALVIEELRLEDFFRLVGEAYIEGTGVLSGEVRIGIPLRNVDIARIPVRGRLSTTGAGTLHLKGVALDYVRENLPEIPIPTNTAGGTENASDRIVKSLQDFAYEDLWVEFAENDFGGTRASVFLSGEGRNLENPIPIGGWTVNVNDFDKLLKLRTILYDAGGEIETDLKGLF